jgi:predicted Kef-type K+ transport protein
LKIVAELGVTLLLFTIGLKLHIRQLFGPHIWMVASLYLVVVVLVFGMGVYGLACLVAMLIPLKAALFSGLLTRMKVTARTSFFTSLRLANYSEFGLIAGIVGGVAVANG